METLLKADIFFFVTTAAVILLTLIGVVVLVYVALAVREIKKLLRRIRHEGEEIMDDVRAVREGVEASGAKIQEVLAWIGRMIIRILFGDSRR